MKKLNIVVIALLVAGCAGRTGTSSNETNPELLVAAAANLTDAFTEVGQRFTSETGIRVVFSFGATADLAKQIENGAPFDVFASADKEHVESLAAKGLLTPGTQALYTRGRLVFWIPPGSALKPQKIEDITAKEFDRIAIAKPDVAPYGAAAVESLQHLHLWGQVEKRVVYAQNVSQAKQYAATGNAEAAFLPLALIKPGEGAYIEIKEDLHQPIDQAIAVIRSSTKQDAAKKFVDFVKSDTVQSLLLSKGYSSAAR